MKPTPRDILIILGITIVMAAADTQARAQDSSTILLRGQALAGDQAVRLEEVATLQGEEARAYAATVVMRFPPGRDEIDLSLPELRRRLSDAGMNWGRVSLQGYSACRVQRRTSEAPTSPPLPVPTPVHVQATEVMLNPQQPISAAGIDSLRVHVERYLAGHAGVDPSELVVRFSERDAAAIDRPRVAQRVEIQPQSSASLGRIPLIVRVWRDGKPGPDMRVTADVARRTLALVAVRPVPRGQAVAPSDVEVREVLIEQDEGGRGEADQPLTQIRDVEQQVAARPIRTGQVLYPQDLEAPILVRRGELINVQCVAGVLVIRTVARASDEGRMGDLVQVRNESSRESFTATVVGRRKAIVQAGIAGADR